MWYDNGRTSFATFIVEFLSLKKSRSRLWQILLLGMCVGWTSHRASPIKNYLIFDAEIEELFQKTVHPIASKNRKLKNIIYFTLLSQTYNAVAILHGSELNPSLPPGPCVVYHASVIMQESFHTFAMILFHELGHISHKHRYVLPSALKEHALGNQAMAVGLGGLIALIAGNVSPLLLALPMWQGATIRNLSTYSRQCEGDADRFAYEAFRRLQWSLDQPLASMKRFSELEWSSDKTDFLSTHPYWKDRWLAGQRYRLSTWQEPSAALLNLYDRVRIKLIAMMVPLQHADRSIDRAPVPEKIKDYGRAIVAWRRNQYDRALGYTETFSRAVQGPDAHIHALRAEIWLSKGNAERALQDINQALRTNNNWVLVTLKSHILHHIPARCKEMIQWTLPSMSQNSLHHKLWIFLAKAYERSHNSVGNYWCQSEYWATQRKWNKALVYAKRSRAAFAKGDSTDALSPTITQIDDLIHHLTNKKRSSSS